MERIIHHGDCMRLMPAMPSGFAAACITDPPYGIAYQSKARVASIKLKKVANDERPYIWWLPEVYRLLRDPGALVCFCRWDVQEIFRTAIELAGFEVRSQLVWDRVQHGSGNVAQDFAPRHDVMWFAVKGEFAFPGRRPHSVIRSQKPHWQAMVHPTEKPVELLLELASALTVPGDTILDPFSGSGSMGEAAALLGLGFVGVELEEEYIAPSRRRLEQAGALFQAPRPADEQGTLGGLS